MSRKSNFLWSRPLAFFGCIVAAFAFAVVLSPSVFAAAGGTVIAHTGGAQADFDINPLNDTEGEQFIALKFQIKDDATLDGGDVSPLWIDQLVLAVGGTGGAASTDIASAKLYSDAGTTLVSTGTVADATITFGDAADADGVGDLISLASDAGQDYWIYIYMKTGAALTATEPDTYTFSINDTASVIVDGDAGSSTMRANANVVAAVYGTVRVTASKLVVTGTASMATTATNELTVTAKDANGNIDEGYTGDKSLTFSGPAVSPDGTAASVEAVDVGSATTVTFASGASGVGEATLVATKVESTTVDATDGTLNSTGSASDDLDLAVTVGAKNKLMILTQAAPTGSVNNVLNPQPVIYITDTYGNKTADTDTVTATDYLVSDCSSAGAGTLSGATKAAVAGIATFTALKHDTAETIYLKYTSGGLTAACSGTASTLLSGASASAVNIHRGQSSSDDSSSSSSTTTSTTTTPTSTSTTTTTTTTATTPTTTTTTTNSETTTTAANRYQQAGVSEADVNSAVGAFSDLAKSAWHSPFIARMRNLGILGGYPDGTVKPDNTINRAELAKIAAKAFGLANASENFSDVADDAWFAPFVGALQSAGAAWTTTANYRPSENVTRGEALWVLLKAAGVDLDGVTVEKLFPDVSTRHRFAAAITFAAQHSIVSGYENGNFGPGDTLTRAQVAKIVALIKDL